MRERQRNNVIGPWALSTLPNREFRVGERMEQTFFGILFRNFGCKSQGWAQQKSVKSDYRSFALGSSVFGLGNRTRHGSDMQVVYLSDDIIAVDWPQQALVCSEKIHKYI